MKAESINLGTACDLYRRIYTENVSKWMKILHTTRISVVETEVGSPKTIVEGN